MFLSAKQTGTITITNYTGSDDVIASSDIDGSGVTSIGHRTFYCSQISSVIIPDSVTSIKAYAFSGNRLTSIIIPDSVRTIEYHAFLDNLLTTITIGANVAIRDRDDGNKKGTGIPNYFDDFYIYNERKAGPYTYMNNQWVVVN